MLLKGMFRPMTMALIVGLALGAPSAALDGEKELGWFDTAEFSLFMTTSLSS